MKSNEHGEGVGLRFWSALVMMVGFLIMVFGASLRSQYSLSTGYSDAVHIRIAPGLIIVIGVVIALLGLFGIVYDLMIRRQ
jgi:hypothetical protein